MTDRPGKIVCVGRNYAAHARELGNPTPERPLLFLKPPSAVIRDGDPIVLPTASRQVEHEAEIAVIVGRRLRNASARDARAAVRAIACLNDVTARDLQKTDGQWTRAKGFDTFCPIGPAMDIDPDFDLSTLGIVGRVNGTVRQQGRAADMIFPIPDLLAYISAIMTLEPGDVVATGTPEGVGRLEDGDTVEIEIPGWTKISNPVVGG
ncbi:MAG TPA: fumarylacetoacetate hydrolase family protein [Gemmatimonadales bacterium]|nr:fumarylacetoacetate hydrolase family protein [Gemmatimonadales bacterium]